MSFDLISSFYKRLLSLKMYKTAAGSFPGLTKYILNFLDQHQNRYSHIRLLSEKSRSLSL